MLTFLEEQNPILLAFLATLFTYSVTLIGASIVFLFKKVKKNIMDAMLGFAAGIMIAASFFSLLEPSLKMAYFYLLVIEYLLRLIKKYLRIKMKIIKQKV